jgi:D-tagatose-1,6-bisphosphate aldolase subunit GatZ/KbaZ
MEERKIRLARKYSSSNRCRHYLPEQDVKDSAAHLIGNLNSIEIPLMLLSQYMPMQYLKARSGAS